MKWVVLAFVWVIVLLCTVVLLSACTVVAKYSYECEGKCKGSLGRDVEVVYPDEELTQPVKPVKVIP